MWVLSCTNEISSADTIKIAGAKHKAVISTGPRTHLYSKKLEPIS